MFAVMEYAQWVRKAESKHRDQQSPSVTLDAMPEVRAVLDRHLNEKYEPTQTIRSVYGQVTGFLASLDWEWFRNNVGLIFPLDQARSKFFSAAWECFVVFNHPHDTLLRELEPAYRKAVAEINLPTAMRSPGSPKDSLSEHLCAYYWRGHLTFEGTDRILSDFYALATDPLRAHAMWFIGRSLAGWEEAVPTEVFERLKVLIERRVAVAEQGQVDGLKGELAGFAWWFTANKLGEEWSLQMLTRILRVTKYVGDGMDVIKQLAETSSRHPLECVSCLELMVQGDRDNWVLVGVDLEARTIIKAALDSGQRESVLTARRLVELLIAKGHYGYRALLPT